MNVAKTFLGIVIMSFTWLSFAYAVDFQTPFLKFSFKPAKQFTPDLDAYIDRRVFLSRSLLVCQNAFLGKKMRTDEVQAVAEKYLLKQLSLINRNDSSGDSWTINFNVNSGPGGYLRLFKSETSYSISYRQSENSIESIASVSFNTSCKIDGGSRFMFFNKELRPIRRIKLNNENEEIQSVVMEEPVKDVGRLMSVSADQIRVGIIDSGLDYNHEKLISKSRPMLGLDLTDPKRPPYDYTNSIFNEMSGSHFSHGTAVADVASRDVDVLLVPARIENKSQLSGAAVEFLASQKVRIVNISQGTERQGDWLSFKEAVANHPEILFIASAGNEKYNLVDEPYYPATFSLPNLIIVASVDAQQQLSSFSNYGADFVHFAALGEKVVAAEAGGGTWTVNGTSFAAPLVTNIAAKLLVANPSLTTQELRALLVAKAKQVPGLEGKVQYGVLTP